jgi:hypothetical protein
VDCASGFRAYPPIVPRSPLQGVIWGQSQVHTVHKSAARGFYPWGRYKLRGLCQRIVASRRSAYDLPTTLSLLPAAAAHARTPFSRTPAPTDACPTEVMPLAVVFIYLSVHRRSFVDDLCVVCAYGMDVCPHSPPSIHAERQKPPQLPKRVWSMSNCPLEVLVCPWATTYQLPARFCVWFACTVLVTGER